MILVHQVLCRFFRDGDFWIDSSEGTLNMTSIMIFSMIERNPRAPVFRSMACAWHAKPLAQIQARCHLMPLTFGIV